MEGVLGFNLLPCVINSSPFDMFVFFLLLTQAVLKGVMRIFMYLLICPCFRCFIYYHNHLSLLFNCSLKDDDSGDHDQDQGSPKNCEKEKNEDEDKEQNNAKKKVSERVRQQHWPISSVRLWPSYIFSVPLCCLRWWYQGPESIPFSTTTPSGIQDAPQGDLPAPRATSRTSNRSAVLPRSVCPSRLLASISYIHYMQFKKD